MGHKKARILHHHQGKLNFQIINHWEVKDRASSNKNRKIGHHHHLRRPQPRLISKQSLETGLFQEKTPVGRLQQLLTSHDLLTRGDLQFNRRWLELEWVAHIHKLRR